MSGLSHRGIGEMGHELLNQEETKCLRDLLPSEEFLAHDRRANPLSVVAGQLSPQGCGHVLVVSLQAS